MITVIKAIMRGFDGSWVLFAHGTVVGVRAPGGDPAGQGREFLAQHGPVIPGTPAGDFGVHRARQQPGWLVSGHRTEMITYVSPEEVDDPAAADLQIGMLGRAKRGEDARELKILHVNDETRTCTDEAG
jgi:hypothetical protein